MKSKILIGSLTVFNFSMAHASLSLPVGGSGVTAYESPSPHSVKEYCKQLDAIPGIGNGLATNADDQDRQKAAAKLCKIDFYSAKAAFCPKNNSTNPGTDIYDLPKQEDAQGNDVLDASGNPHYTMTRSQFEMNECKKAESARAGKRVAKYKSSISCSYTPSILAYYQLSRLMDGAAHVPSSVLRTMDLKEHVILDNVALQITTDTIHDTWSAFAHDDQNPQQAHQGGLTPATASKLYTDDFDQIYGALLKQAGNEGKFREIDGGGGSDKTAIYKNIRTSNPYYLAVTTASNLGTSLSRNFNFKTVQGLQHLKDMSSIIILDYLLNQQDRLGNTHKLAYYEYLKDGHIQKDAAKEYDMDQLASTTAGFHNVPVATWPDKRPQKYKDLGAVVIEELFLKDNDCGVAKENLTKENGISPAAIRHMGRRAYQGLQTLTKQITSDPSGVKKYFADELRFTASDYASFLANINTAVSAMTANCKNGSLKLDLDYEDFAVNAPTTAADCTAGM